MHFCVFNDLKRILAYQGSISSCLLKVVKIDCLKFAPSVKHCLLPACILTGGGPSQTSHKEEVGGKVFACVVSGDETANDTKPFHLFNSIHEKNTVAQKN